MINFWHRKWSTKEGLVLFWWRIGLNNLLHKLTIYHPESCSYSQRLLNNLALSVPDEGYSINTLLKCCHGKFHICCFNHLDCVFCAVAIFGIECCTCVDCVFVRLSLYALSASHVLCACLWLPLLVFSDSHVLIFLAYWAGDSLSTGIMFSLHKQYILIKSCELVYFIYCNHENQV